MRKAPNYVLGEAVDGIWKRELLSYLGKEFNLKTLIETGTCDGGTLIGILDDFEYIHTIELSDYYYNISKRIFANYPHIKLYKGNSSVVLRDVLQNTPNVPTLFWLDAHPSGGLTANDGDPLPDEIKAVMELRPNSLVVIDDQQDDLLQNVIASGVDLAGWTKEFRTGVVFLHNGSYNIPEFND
jgi:hypothetical protein